MSHRTTRTALLLGILAAADPAFAEPIVVMVDRDNPKTDISLSELKSYFTGRQKEWPDGQRVVPLDLASADRAAFDQAALGMSADDYDRWWVDQKVRGQGTPPKAFSPESVVKLTARVRGALGYVRASQADASVKVLTVEGKAPGTAGYPLNAP
jgi:ABC-type phosphate transport system substrate-binding protein